jgi:hypothetical protein
MAGEGGGFVMTKDHNKAIDDGPLGKRGINKVLRKWAKKREKANRYILKMTDERKFAKMEALLKSDSSISAAIDQGGNLTALEQCRFHINAQEQNRKLARQARAGANVISVAHGEAMGRMYDKIAEFHAEQARGTKVL